VLARTDTDKPSRFMIRSRIRIVKRHPEGHWQAWSSDVPQAIGQ
jgi:hypothetical protein